MLTSPLPAITETITFPASTPGFNLPRYMLFIFINYVCHGICFFGVKAILRSSKALARILEAFGIHLILTWIRILRFTFGKRGSGSSDPPFRKHMENVNSGPGPKWIRIGIWSGIEGDPDPDPTKCSGSGWNFRNQKWIFEANFDFWIRGNVLCRE